MGYNEHIYAHFVQIYGHRAVKGSEQKGSEENLSNTTLGQNTADQTGTPVFSLVIPAYNEEARIGPALLRMREYLDQQPYPCEILVIDDGSTDDTCRVVQAVEPGSTLVRLHSYTPNRGKGYAVRYGMLRAQGERVLFADADLATPIEEMEHLMQALDNGADIAIGSRDMRGSHLDKRQSAVRELGGKLFNRVVRLLTVPGIHDTQCGFKLFTRSAVQQVFPRCQIDHFAFDVEMLFIATRLCELKTAEVPVRWAHQEGSKVRFLRDGLRMLRAVWQIRTTRYTPAAHTQAELHPR